MNDIPIITTRSSRPRKYTYSIIKKKRKSLLGLIFALIFFILFQAAISMYVNLNTVYNYRINYNMFLKDQQSIEVVIDEIAKTIKKKNLSNYVILIGNSVAWGTNESSDHSMGRYMSDLAISEEKDSVQAIFNLSAPSMQAGDAYTLLLMLDKKGIKTDNVMIGLTYTAFNNREAGPRAVFWLGDYLRKEDPEAFSEVLPQLIKNGYKYKTGWKNAEEELLETVFHELPIIKYKDVIPAYTKQKAKGTDLLGNPKPWYEKTQTAKKLTSRDYLNFFNPTPFDMTEANWGVYFMNRIIEHQEGKRTLVFVAGGNGELSKKEISNPGYQNNLKKVDSYLASKPIQYIMLEGLIDQKMFTDHVHLTKDGYQQLARLVWDCWTGKEA